MTKLSQPKPSGQTNLPLLYGWLVLGTVFTLLAWCGAVAGLDMQTKPDPVFSTACVLLECGIPLIGLPLILIGLEHRQIRMKQRS